MHCDDRKNRGLTQRILLIDHSKINDGYKFELLGTTNRSYNVLLTNDKKPSCTCMDYKFSKRNCKHLYFLFNICQQKIVHLLQWI